MRAGAGLDFYGIVCQVLNSLNLRCLNVKITKTEQSCNRIHLIGPKKCYVKVSVKNIIKRLKEKVSAKSINFETLR